MSNDFEGRFVPPPQDVSGGTAAIDWPGEHPPEDPTLTAEEFSSELLDARAAVEEALRAQAPQRRGRFRTQDDLTEALNLQGVGIGSSPDSRLGMLPPGSPALTVYLAQPRSAAHVRELLVEELGVRSAAANNVDVNPVTTGLITASSHNFKWRPAPGGVSASHVFGNVGTMGCLATGRTAPRNERLLIVSNNHVFARNNDALFGDRILQQGTDDGGTDVVDQIAIVESYVSLAFDGSVNFVDAATAWAVPSLVGSGQLVIGATGPGTYLTSTTPTTATRGMYVAKSGRTTEFTQGRVAEVGVAHWAAYQGGAAQAFFSNSIAVENAPLFGSPGDSGSLVWTGVDRNPVGLLFAASSGQRAYLNNIDNVLNSLGIFLVS